MSDDLLKAVREHGNIAAAARALGMPESTLRGRLRGAVPLSEDQRKFQPDWTADDCIAELQRIAKIDDTKVITRNYFRVHSDISESTWNRHFGTFLEFKRQAGIILSRHAHGMERAIAKHASKDNQRRMNAEKQQWEGKYLRSNAQRWQSCLVGSDIHDKLCDPFYRRLFIETAQRAQPEKIVLNGDIFDLTEFGKYTQDPRQFDVLGRLKWVHQFLAELRQVAPDAEIIFVEGNHEFRLLRHMTEATPALMVVLADLHGMTVPDLLGLTKYEVNYIARMDLAAFNEADIKKELAKNYVLLWDALLFHHFPEGRNMGYPGANGHHHKHLVWNHYSPQFGPYEWHQLGAGHIRQASYCAGEKWSNGFLLCHVDTHTKRTQFEYIDCSHGHAMIGGRFYERQPNELLAA
ncbi:metallophosphoesterase [Burkholderia pseudomallei]|uniref:metallophosphoesterase n=1 Tax=Burkholderia pseudomallei TaxID=28450 RepID=UPI0012F5227C|nr:metallophosphoesterase [Burkholderia pseudomallei]